MRAALRYQTMHIRQVMVVELQVATVTSFQHWWTVIPHPVYVFDTKLSRLIIIRFQVDIVRQLQQPSISTILLPHIHHMQARYLVDLLLLFFDEPIRQSLCEGTVLHVSSFSALTMSVRGQEKHPACKKLGVGLLMVTVWLEICTSYSSSFHHHLYHP